MPLLQYTEMIKIVWAMLRELAGGMCFCIALKLEETHFASASFKDAICQDFKMTNTRTEIFRISKTY